MIKVPWKFRLAVAAVAFGGVLVAAWVYVPDFQEALPVVWGDTKVVAREGAQAAGEAAREGAKAAEEAAREGVKAAEEAAREQAK